MIIKGLTECQLNDAILQISPKYMFNVYLSAIPHHTEASPFHCRGKYNEKKFRVRLSPNSSSGVGTIFRHRVKKTRIHACCSHVFRDFIRELYNINPNARVITAYVTYKSKDDFEQKYEDVMIRFDSRRIGCYCQEGY